MQRKHLMIKSVKTQVTEEEMLLMHIHKDSYPRYTQNSHESIRK